MQLNIGLGCWPIHELGSRNRNFVERRWHLSVGRDVVADRFESLPGPAYGIAGGARSVFEVVQQVAEGLIDTHPR